MVLTLTIETEPESDGRWIAEIMEIPGAMAYGETRKESVSKAQALALRVIAERIERGEDETALVSLSFRAA